MIILSLVQTRSCSASVSHSVSSLGTVLSNFPVRALFALQPAYIHPCLISPVLGKHLCFFPCKGKAQSRGKGEMMYPAPHAFLDAKTLKASSCWECAGGITLHVTLDLGQENSKYMTPPEITGNCAQWCWTWGRSTNLWARNCGIKAEGFDVWRKKTFTNISQTMQILYLKCP